MNSEFNHVYASLKKSFLKRFKASLRDMSNLYNHLYAYHPKRQEGLDKMLEIIKEAFDKRNIVLKERDIFKLQSEPEYWFLSNQLCGMSLYVDRFCGTITNLQNKLDYFERLGINFLHLMPLFETPKDESDGGYAVSDFRKVNSRFGTLEDLISLQEAMRQRNMYLMLDIVLNHTSDQHEWALKAKQGDKNYQDYFYFFNDRKLPDAYEKSMPEIFPEAAPGSFTYIKDCNKWVMSVFYNYQWDLNYSNPQVFADMLENIFFYANLGVDILRIDAPAFIWKEAGTSCQNLPEAHMILQLIKQCVQIASPGMALLGEAIVAPAEIMKYFGTGNMKAKECDIGYNATQMALQWDVLATGDTRVMLSAQKLLLEKPYGTSWITYTRCHDDIGLGYDDDMIVAAGFNAYEHRKFLKNYYSGNYPDSPAKGALFAVNDKTGDARISGSLASLCGLETAVDNMDKNNIAVAIRKILMMQAQSFFIGGIPVLFYGDESGYMNDYSYKEKEEKKRDNRWMHRPVIDWEKNKNIDKPGTIEQIIFSSTQKLINIRKKLTVVKDKKNLTWLTPHNIHVVGFLRAWETKRIYCLFNYSNEEQYLTWYVFKEHGMKPGRLFDYWTDTYFEVGMDNEYFVLPSYSFFILEPK